MTGIVTDAKRKGSHDQDQELKVRGETFCFNISCYNTSETRTFMQPEVETNELTYSRAFVPDKYFSILSLFIAKIGLSAIKNVYSCTYIHELVM